MGEGDGGETGARNEAKTQQTYLGSRLDSRVRQFSIEALGRRAGCIEVAMDENERICTCHTCLQRTIDYEKDWLPDREEEVKWAKKNKERKTGKECYPCEKNRKKEHKDKSQKEVIELMD